MKGIIALGRERFVKDSHIFPETWREPPNFVVGVITVARKHRKDTKASLKCFKSQTETMKSEQQPFIT
eukprot:5693918-Amphidinium_carterae.1